MPSKPAPQPGNFDLYALVDAPVLGERVSYNSSAPDSLRIAFATHSAVGGFKVYTGTGYAFLFEVARKLRIDAVPGKALVDALKSYPLVVHSPLLHHEEARAAMVNALDKALIGEYINNAVLAAMTCVFADGAYPVLYLGTENYIWGVAPPSPYTNAGPMRLETEEESPFRLL